MAKYSNTVADSRTVKISEAKRLVRRAMMKQRPVFLWGPPGIGKSDLAAQLADELGAALVDVRLNLWEPTDIKGIPYYNAKDNTMSWAPPSELPNEEFASKHKMVVLFLDELAGAPPAVQSAAYQLILNRQVGTYKLPKNVVIMAAGNRMTDKGVTYRMPSPLANRFVHLELRPDFTDFNQWALTNRINQDVVGYLNYAKGDLFNFDPTVHDRSFATPRSWVFVSELLENAEEDGLTENEQTDLVAGCIGEGLAIKFMAHRKIAKDLPRPEDILAGKVTVLKVKEVSAMYSLTTGLCYELKDGYDNAKKEGTLDNWHKMCEFFIQYMMDNFEPEMVIMGAHTALKNYNLPFDHKKLKNFPDFFKRYAHLVVDVDN